MRQRTSGEAVSRKKGRKEEWRIRDTDSRKSALCCSPRDPPLTFDHFSLTAPDPLSDCPRSILPSFSFLPGKGSEGRKERENFHFVIQLNILRSFWKMICNFIFFLFSFVPQSVSSPIPKLYLRPPDEDLEVISKVSDHHFRSLGAEWTSWRFLTRASMWLVPCWSDSVITRQHSRENTNQVSSWQQIFIFTFDSRYFQQNSWFLSAWVLFYREYTLYTLFSCTYGQ